jgi:4-alpha-glucanotransferase
VRYNHEAMIGIVALEAHRASALVVGEDLGTVEPWVRDYLRARGVLGTSFLWFELDRDGSGGPLAAERGANTACRRWPPTTCRQLPAIWRMRMCA